MKKLIIAIALIVLGGGVYFALTANKNNPSDSVIPVYTDPKTAFFPASQVSESDLVVKITDQGFDPVEVTIKKGQKVTWVNNSNQDAWPASDPHPTHTIYPEFDVQLPLGVNKAWAFTFERVGSWGYHNHLSPSMRGTVHVTE